MDLPGALKQGLCVWTCILYIICPPWRSTLLAYYVGSARVDGHQAFPAKAVRMTVCSLVYQGHCDQAVFLETDDGDRAAVGLLRDGK